MDEVINKIAKSIFSAKYQNSKIDYNKLGEYFKKQFVAEAKAIIETLSIYDLEIIINEKRYAEKARKMIEADSRDL